MILLKKFITEIKNNGFNHALRRARVYLIRNNSKVSRALFDTDSFGGIDYNPFVSIIAVNYNGAKDLTIFLDSIKNQSYKNFELIIVDNNSSDNSKEIINEYQKKFPKIVYLNSGKNLGFAAGNNYAIPYCKGELFCLINIDTKIDENWLKELIDAMSQDRNSGAVCSKTLFYEKFQDIELKFEKDFKIEITELINTLQYKKYFIRDGYLENDFIKSKNQKIIISLPIQDELLKFKISDLIDNGLISVKIGKNKINYFKVSNDNLILDINFSQENTINSSYIINNAGSISIADMPGDRGIGEYDIGQYDSKCYVDFFCGVSVLLRRSLLIDRTIFVPEFFAYYEDSELSRYIREKGYKILYAPRSIVYHKHSTTSSEGSPLWQLLVRRSQKIYNYQNDFNKLYREITLLEEHYKNQIPQELYTILKEFSSKLLEKLKDNNSIVEKLKPIGIYNSYWNTKGGGESHALSFATILQKYETVYLISEEDFSIDELSEYYKIDLTNCRKIVQNNINADFTKQFHIFINSTFQSNLESNARKSYYIVYFPQKNINSILLDKYEFLYMNDYTRNWGTKYWGTSYKSNIIYPLAMLEQIKEFDKNIKKEKIIISVGRFFVGGHSKRQDLIAKAFKNLFNSTPDLLNDWKLVLIGSLDFTQKINVDYVNEINEELVNVNYEIITNANKEVLVNYYKKSFIYIHASGYGINEDLHPENIEHFGITPIEAMQYGCYPIVYEIGGPKETLEKANIGLYFKTEKELENQILNAIKMFDEPNTSNKVFNSIKNFIEINNPTNLINRLYVNEKDKQ